MQVTELLVDRHYEYFLQIADQSPLKKILLEDFSFYWLVRIQVQLHLNQTFPFKQLALLIRLVITCYNIW